MELVHLSLEIEGKSRGNESSFLRLQSQWLWQRQTYISGSFCVSITAAMGIPKLETGPQKSTAQQRQPIRSSGMCETRMSHPSPSAVSCPAFQFDFVGFDCEVVAGADLGREAWRETRGRLQYVRVEQT